MSDIPGSSWSEADASNNQNPPAGWPEGMNPSDVNNSARAMMGATKRFWNRINAVETTGGSSSAYTLTYDVAAAQYYDGEIFTFIVNAANAAAATLNINGLGARQITLFGGNLLAGALLANQIVQARYNSSAGTFDLIPQNSWVRIGEQNPSGATEADFTGIPAGVNHLRALYQVRPGTNDVSLLLRTYDAGGSLDTAGYAYACDGTSSQLTYHTGGSGSATLMPLNVDSVPVNNGADVSISGEAKLQNIQSAQQTAMQFESFYLGSGGAAVMHARGGGWRAEADRITGLRFFFASGTMTGKISLYASA